MSGYGAPAEGGSRGVVAPYPLCEDTVKHIEYIPIRLTQEERKRQRMVKAVVSASDYTDKVDVLAGDGRPDPKRTTTILKEQISTLTAMFFADAPLQDGVAMCEDADIGEMRTTVMEVFELSRRYKVMNPEVMKTDYGKLLHIIQDSVQKEIADQQELDTLAPIQTVASRAKEMGIEALLEEPLLPLATTPVPRLASIHELNQALRRKDRTVRDLVRKYASRRARDDDVEWLIRSIDDANCYLRDNAETIDTMLALLEENFDPEQPQPGLALSISEGESGSRLTHEHAKQFHFVKQSLTLWRSITRAMYRLWLLMEQDFLDPENPYSLTDTGQGAHRKQSSPRLYAAMMDILAETKASVDCWIGSDRVHMGDNQVPNGFVFIQKYSQISSIINPILCTLRAVKGIAKDPDHQRYIAEVWATPAQLEKAILCDFFRHGFDGSGGDNDMDAGSCIDGRLTSAWHWCNTIKTKPFYPIFLLSGFSSFDGGLGGA